VGRTVFGDVVLLVRRFLLPSARLIVLGGRPQIHLLEWDSTSRLGPHLLKADRLYNIVSAIGHRGKGLIGRYSGSSA
jgi:hypothetical protein